MEGWSVRAYHGNFFEWQKQDVTGPYDLIIGNPPWGKKRINDSGYSERALDFIFPCVEMLSPRGNLAFVLPGIWLTGMEHEPFRSRLLSLGRDLKITRLLGNWFEDAAFTAEPVILYIGKPCKKHLLNLDHYKKKECRLSIYMRSNNHKYSIILEEKFHMSEGVC